MNTEIPTAIPSYKYFYLKIITTSGQKNHFYTLHFLFYAILFSMFLSAQTTNFLKIN